MAALSFWEQRSFTDYDFVIVGAGLVGLSTAISLAEKKPQASILVLERGIFPSGASTKNAGFACFGSLTELSHDLIQMGSEEMLALVEERWLGLQQLRNRLGDKNIGYKNHGGYELIREQEVSKLEHLEEINHYLEPLFKKEVFSLAPKLIKDFGFGERLIKSIIYNPFEGQIDTGLMMSNLLKLAQGLGIQVLTGAKVQGFDENDKQVQVDVVTGPDKDHLRFRTSQLGICTNAFTSSLLPGLDLKPGRGLVLVTKPISNLKFKGVFHYDSGYFYFRNFRNRVIFGGGRNLDLEGEQTEKFGINQALLNHLTQELKTMILPGQRFEIDQTWSGIMAFGENKQPILQGHSNRVVLGVRLGGMGIAIGSRLGEKLAEMMCK
ncbi:MAG: NAD(P)/FAD-dependent oxidoreductase [Cyclobacteriaceae bacterium]